VKLLNLSWNFAPERIVVVIYLFSIVCPLIGLILGGFRDDEVGRQVFLVLTIPFSILFFLPFFHITVATPTFLPHRMALPPAPSPLPEPLWFFVLVGWLALLLFYPVVSYLLWNRFRVGWVLSLFAAVSTIGLSLYLASIEVLAEGLASLPLTDWTFGVVANSIMLILLWRCKNAFFKPGRAVA
jgi:hypothetical protein